MNGNDDLVNTNVIDFRTNAQLRASTSFDDDPEKAAKALAQEKTFNVPAQTILGDPEGWDEMFKRSLGDRIISKNTHLQDFLNAHPVHGALIHDDLGPMDKLSQSYRSLLAEPLRDAIDAFNQQFPPGHPGRLGLGGTLTQAPPPEEPQDVEFAKRHPTLFSYLNPIAYLLGVPSRTISGAFAAADAGGQSLLKGAGASDQTAQQTMRQLLGIAEAEMARQMGNVGKIGPKEYFQRLAEQRPDVAQAAGKINELAQDAEPFIKNGKPPPVGAAPEFDLYHQEAAKADAKAMQEMLKAAQETALRERSPDALEEFIASHGDRTIGIQADAVRELYGNTAPSPNDSKLGFIPNLASQLAAAEQYGGDVEVPLSTWLAKVPSETAKELADFVRVREGGMTPFEAKEGIQVYHGSPYEFEKFDTSKIGTGEGAQSYGHGLYVAENPEVAQEYIREPFSKQPMEGGNLYTAKILQPKEAFLDWDKPALEQSPELQAKLKAAGLDFEATKNMALQSALDTLGDPTKAGYDQAAISAKLSEAGIPGIKYLDQGSRPGYDLVDLKRSVAYWEKELEGAKTEGEKQQLELALRQAQKALAEEEAKPGTHNYVVFNDKDLEITHKNAVPVSAGAAATPESLRRATRVYEGATQSGFNTNALSQVMTTEMFRKYQDAITKELEAKQAKQQEVADKLAKKRVTKAWKDAEKALRPEVEKEITSRPEIQAARVLDVTKGKGIPPDDLAATFGYASGDEMMRAYNTLKQARGRMQPKEYERQLIKEELARQMEAKHGILPDEIIKEAKDYVLAPTVMDRIAEEVQALGMKAGGQAPISKEELASWVKQNFASMPATAISSDKFLAFAGKAARAAEKALLEDKHTDAFKAKQIQQKALFLAREALDFERKQAGLERNIARYSPREGPDSVASRYTHQIQDLLQRLGVAIQRPPKDLAEQIARDGTGTLPQFVAKEVADGQLLDVADFLLDPNFRGELKDLTAEQYLGLASSIKIMDKIGRDAEVQTINAGRNKIKDIVGEMKPRMERFGEVPNTFKKDSLVKRLAEDLPASLMNMETLLRHFDHSDPFGPFQRYFLRPIVDAPNQHRVWQKEYGGKYQAIGKLADVDKKVDNPWIRNPDTGKLFQLTRNDIDGIIAHWGNESNRDKLLKGWGIISKEGKPEDHVTRQEFERWLVENSRPEDWKRAEQRGKIFNEIFNDKAKPLYYRSTGDTPEALELTPFSNAHGSFDGWYNPISYDSRFAPPRPAVNAVGLLSPDFKSMLPSNAYAKSRTGYYGPVEIDAGLIPLRMNQMLHDIAYREAIVNVNKIARDKSFRAMINNHYGEKYADMIDKWLQFIVNGANVNEGPTKTMAQLSSYLRTNVVGSYINFNWSTPMKHGPTALAFSARAEGGEFAKEFSRVLWDPRTWKRDNDFAMQSSQLLQARNIDFQDSLVGAQAMLEQGLGKSLFSSARAWSQYLGTWMVRQSDWVSTNALWKATYKRVFRETLDHDEAVAQADQQVRLQHGTSAPTNLPPALQGQGELTKWSTALYTFFGTRYQRMLENAWDMNEMYKLGKEGELRQAARMIPKVAADYATYTVLPMMVDSVVGGMRLGLSKSLVIAMIAGPLTSIPFAREIYHALVEGVDPETGLLGSAYKDLSGMWRRYTGKTKQTAGRVVSDLSEALGIATGVGGRALGKGLGYITDLFTGAQPPPKGPGEALHGVKYGTTRERK